MGYENPTMYKVLELEGKVKPSVCLNSVRIWRQVSFTAQRQFETTVSKLFMKFV